MKQLLHCIASHHTAARHCCIASHHTATRDTVASHRITRPCGSCVEMGNKREKKSKKDGLCFESENSARRCARQARKVDFSLLRLANAARLAFKVADLTVPQLDPPTVRTLADPSLREGVDHSGCVTWQREVLINQCEQTLAAIVEVSEFICVLCLHVLVAILSECEGECQMCAFVVCDCRGE
jgi:hypothetical protein